MFTIRLCGDLVQALLDISPKVYKPYVTKDKKRNFILLLRCLNAIYGTIIAGLLFYKKVRKTFLREGFEINPYDPCVANKMVNGKQQTIFWHVDNCKLSHRDKRVNNRFILVLKEEHESIFEDGFRQMTVSRRKIHNYLGMKLDYKQKGLCYSTMLVQITETIEIFE